MRKVAKDFVVSTPYQTADGLNKEGFPTWKPASLEEEFLQVLMTNVAEPTFYASQKEQIDETFDVHRRMLDEDPEFYARAIVFARNKGLMRLQPVIGLTFLSTIPGHLFGQAFRQVIRTPADLKNFVALCKGATIRKGLGTKVKKAVNEYLNGMSEYHAIKYGGKEQFSLANILRLCRPKPKDQRQSAIFNWAVHEETPDKESGLYQIISFEELKGLVQEYNEWKEAMVREKKAASEVEVA